MGNDPARLGGARAWRRVRAGLLIEGGYVPEEAIRHWRAAAVDPAFDPDEFADDVLAEARAEGADARVEARTAALVRELLGAPVGRAPVSRGRRRTRSGIALFVYQVYMLAVWGGLALAGALLLRMRGVEFDGLLDGLLAIFH